jgi:hypothetical protein
MFPFCLVSGAYAAGTYRRAARFNVPCHTGFASVVN